MQAFSGKRERRTGHARMRRCLLKGCEQRFHPRQVAAEGQSDRYVAIDGYKRIAALEQLGRDTVEAVMCR